MTLRAVTQLDEHLKVSLDPELPASLVSVECLESIHAVARNFPAAITEFFGLECRLGEVEPSADFLFCMKTSESGRQVLSGQLGHNGIPEAFSDHPVWRNIRQFADSWADPKSLLHTQVDNVWFEFDLPSSHGSQPAALVPNLFFGTEALKGKTPQDPDLNHADHAWLWDEALPLLFGASPTTELILGLKNAISALPEGAWIFQTGVMLGRSARTDLLRICVRGLSRDIALTYLKDLGWNGPLEELTRVVGDAFERADSVDLDLDLLPELAPKIGLECSFIATEPSRYRLPAFLDYLVGLGICVPGKAQGLLSWSRGFHERTNPEAWPADLRQRSVVLGKVTASMFIRWLYHVKLVYQPNQRLEAKAYLAIRQAWPTAATVRQAVAIMQEAG